MKKIGTLKPGTIFNFAKEQFVVLEQMENGVFCLLAQSKKSVQFNSSGAKERNNYIGSTLESEVNTWLEALPKTAAEEKAILPFTVDLFCTDRSKSYGEITVEAAPLTLWQYGKYKKLIPLNEDGWWWLVTPWACRRLRSSDTYDTNYAWIVLSSGDIGSVNFVNTCGVRPALYLSSDLWVSVEGDDEEDGGCGGDNPYVDLSRVDTLTLVREVERRLSHGEVYGADSQDAEEDTE